MFGMGITEILLIAIVAVIALGPEKLPDAMVKIARLFNSVKKGITRSISEVPNNILAKIKEIDTNKHSLYPSCTHPATNLDLDLDLNLDLTKPNLNDKLDFELFWTAYQKKNI